MRKFVITVSDIATYEIEAENPNIAKSIAWNWFNERKPVFEIKEVEENDVE